jgi:hypothetical protein
MKENRFVLMSAITEQTWNFLLGIISRDDFVQPVCYETFIEFFNKRAQKKNWLRPYVTAMFYECLSNHPYSEVMPVIAVSEVFNISTYQSNTVFDKKLGPTPINIDGMNQFIASYLSMGMANRIIMQSGFDDKVKLSLLDLLNQCNEKIYKGQSLDINMLVLDNAETMLNDECFYHDLYSKRCDLIAGASVEFCALSAAIAAKVDDESTIDSLHRLACQWGGIMQIINDLSDYFVIQGNRGRYFDVRADKLTLPLFLILKQESSNIVPFIRKYDDSALEAFFNRLIYKDSPVVMAIFDMLKSKWGHCKKEILNLGLSKEFAQGLFESAFLNTYSRRLFSNKLIKWL